jgi:hypothetical protein
MRGDISPFPNTSSWHDAQLKAYLFSILKQFTLSVEKALLMQRVLRSYLI